MTSPKDSAASVKVVVRLRPMNEKEKKEGTLPVISCSTANRSITVIKGKGSSQKRTSYQFENVLGSFSTQEEVFDLTLKPIISDVLDGFETCIFAYGQTGTGKTHTMEGSLETVEKYGLIPRSAQAIFDALEGSTYNVSCSYLEIYNEELSDLLVDDPLEKRKLDVLSSSAVKVKGLSSRSVSTTEEVLRCVTQSNQNRKVGETSMNKSSSRSHCIFTINVERKTQLPNGDVIESKGKLHLVDLAGSESAKTSTLKSSSAHAQATRDQERRNINQSLLALGRVIAGLTEKRGIVPYRDSKLTRILQEALGGRCKTVIIATVSPSIMNLNESIQTLQYATKAQNIQNKPVATAFMTMNSPGRGGPMGSSENMIPAERWEEMEIRMQHMQHEVEEARSALARKYTVEQELVSRAECAEEKNGELEQQVADASEKLELLTNELAAEREAKQLVEDELECTRAELQTRTEELTAEREAKQLVEEELERTKTELAKRTDELRVEREAKQLLMQKLRNTTIELEKRTMVLKATQQTEIALTNEAEALLNVLRKSIADGDELHAIIKAKREDEVEKRKATAHFHDTLLLLLEEVSSRFRILDESQGSHCAETNESLSLDLGKQLKRMAEGRRVMATLVQKVRELSDDLRSLAEGEIKSQLESLQASVTSNLSAAQSTANDGEAQLSENCEGLRNQLRDYKANFVERKTDHKKCLDTSLEMIELKLEEVRQKMKSFVDDSTTKLQAVSKGSATTREALAKDLEDWSTACVETATASKDLSSKQQQLLDENREILRTEMDRYDTISKTLSSQRDLLGRTRASQNGTLSNQMGLLHNHEQEIKAAKKSQEVLCHSVIKNVMSGVEALVNEQVKQILAQHEVTTERLLKRNTESMSLNEEIKASAETFIDDVSGVNDKIGIEANKLEEADLTICSVVGDAAKAFEEIGSTSTRQLQTRDHFVALTNGHASILQSLEARSVNIEGRLRSSGDECRDHITNTTSTSIKESVSETGKVASDALDHVLDATIPSSLLAVDKLEEPRSQILQDVTDRLQNTETTVSRDIGALESASRKQTEMTCSATKHCCETESVYASTVDEDENQCKENTKRLTESIKANKESIEELSNQCKVIVTESGENTTSFGNDVIHMTMEVEPVSPRNVLEFSDQLSATPPEATILKGFEKPQDPTSTCTEHLKDEVSTPPKLTSIHILRESLSVNAEDSSPQPSIEPSKRRASRTSRLHKIMRAKER